MAAQRSPRKRVERRPPREKLDPKLVLGAMGPGMVAALAGADAGGVAAYSNAGALYGFGLLWTVPVMCLLLIVVQETAARMGCVTGKGFASLIREQYGIRPTVVAMLALLVSNATVTLSEFAGIASGFALFGIPTYVSVPASAVAIWMLTMSGSYRRIEKILLAISCVFLTYVVAGFMVEPDWGAAFHDTFIPPFSSDLSYLSLIVALVGTTIAPWMIFLAQSNVVERDAREKDIPYQRIDTVTGSIVASAISWFIILVTGAVLYPAGIVVEGAEDADRVLKALEIAFLDPDERPAFELGRLALFELIRQNLKRVGLLPGLADAQVRGKERKGSRLPKKLLRSRRFRGMADGHRFRQRLIFANNRLGVRIVPLRLVFEDDRKSGAEIEFAVKRIVEKGA